MSAWVRGATARYREAARRYPTLLFGVPFISSIVFAMSALATITRSRYDQHDHKLKTLNREEQLQLRRDRKKFDVREEYFVCVRRAGRARWLTVQKLESQADKLDDWEPQRVARPKGMPEWGGMPQQAPEGQEAVQEDLGPNSSSSFFSRRQPVQAEERPADEQDSTPPPGAKSGRHERVVLGPDGKPCRACSSKLAFSAAMRRSGGGAAAAGASAKLAHPEDPCPADVEELGHSTWTFLHSAAAYYPQRPTPVQREAMRALLGSLPHVYPCSWCAEELREEYARQNGAAGGDRAIADAVADGETLRRWLCTLHNSVNVRLGKPEWDCSDATRLRHRWYEPPEEKEC